MNRIENTAAEHQEIGELLPWFVNGRLSETDRQRVDAHLRVCEACTDELAAQQRICSVMSVDAGVERMPVAGLNRLRTRIESLDDAVPAPAAPDEAARSEAPAGSSLRQRRSAIAASRRCSGISTNAELHRPITIR
jgi:anti-sigma factor RsiW